MLEATTLPTTTPDDGRNLGDSGPAISPPAAPVPALAVAASQQAEPRNRGGAPVGNENARRHGLRSPRGPKSDRYIDRTVQEFRRSLESGVLAACDEISVYHAALVHSACEATRVALSELQELRKLIDADKLDPQHRTAKRQAALKALDLRDRKLRELGIAWQAPTAEGPADPWEEFDAGRKLDSLPQPAPSPDAAEKPQQPSASASVVWSSDPVASPPKIAEKLTSETEGRPCPQ